MSRQASRSVVYTLLMIVAMTASPIAGAESDVSTPTAHEVESLVHAAREGNPQAQYRLAQAYESGAGTRQSYSEAVRWYRAAANQGLARAQFHLALIFEEGRPEVKRDVAYALSWYEEAARNGFKSAVERLRRLTDGSTL